MAGSQRSCCSGEPHSTMVPIARPLCTPMKVAIDGSTLAISSPTKPVSSWLAGRRIVESVGLPDDADLGQRFDDLERKLRAGPAFLGDGCDVCGHELAGSTHDVPLLGGQHRLVAEQVGGEQVRRLLVEVCRFRGFGFAEFGRGGHVPTVGVDELSGPGWPHSPRRTSRRSKSSGLPSERLAKTAQAYQMSKEQSDTHFR